MTYELFLVLFVCFTAELDKTNANAHDARPMVVPGLSCPFMLGQLFDATRDRLLSGIKLWDQGKLDENVVEKQLPNTASNVIIGSSLSKKARALDIKAELKISFLCGLLSARGSAKFLKTKASSNYMAEVSLQYHRRTHMAELTMGALGHVDYPLVFDIDNGATHVVTAIEYGADSIFQFKKETSSYEERKKIEGKLVVAMSLIVAKAKGSAEVKFSESDMREYSSISCSFNGDVDLPNPPTTLLDAVQVYKTMPGLINSTSAVPITVYLTPLSHLDSTAQRLVRQISESLLTEVSNRFEKYDEIERSIGDLEFSQAYALMPLFKDHVDDFKSALNVHKIKFQSQLLDVLPRVRGTGAEQFFTMAKLSRWISWKQREAGALRDLLTWNSSLIVATHGEFEAIVYNTNNKHVVSFTLELYPLKDEFVRCVTYDCGPEDESTYLCSLLSCSANTDYKSWLQDPTFASEMYGDFYKYKQAVEINQQTTPSTSMIIREEPIKKKIAIEDSKIFRDSVEVYENRILVDMDFKPKIAQYVTERNCTAALVSWSVTGPEESLSHWMTGEYKVMHRLSPDGKWKENSVSDKNDMLFEYSQNQDFEVVIAAFCSFGVCALSDEVVYEGAVSNASSCSPPPPPPAPVPDLKIVVIGGINAKARSSMELYHPFNPQLNHVINGEMRQGRLRHTSALMDDGTVITVGGWGGGGYLSSCERFTPSTSTVTKCPSLKTKRQSAASCIFNGVLYVCGGWNGRRSNSCERLLSNVWQNSVSLNNNRSHLSMVTLNEYFYAIGGHDGHNTLSSVERRSITDQHWTFVQSMNNQRRGHSSAVMDGKIFVCGGWDGSYICPLLNDTIPLTINGFTLQKCIENACTLHWSLMESIC